MRRSGRRVHKADVARRSPADGLTLWRSSETPAGATTTPGREQASLAQKQRDRLDMYIAKFARKRLDRLERRVLEIGADMDRNDPLQLHQLRIDCKRLRYATEFFSLVIPGLDDFIDQLKGFQNLLGVLHEVSVMGSLLDDLLAAQSDLDVMRYAGGPVGWRALESYELLNSFEDRRQAFVQVKQPRWHPRHGQHHK